MLNAYRIADHALARVEATAEFVPPDAIWIDLLQPVLGEDKVLEKFLGIEIPTREEMREIEPSSRLYTEGGVRYLTATLLCNTDLGAPKLTQISFILSENRLVTVRYDTPKPINLFLNRAQKPGAIEPSAEGVLMGLLETIVDRIADILERVGEDIDGASTSIFASRTGRGRRAEVYESVLQTLGTKGELVSKARESLVSIGRLLLFLSADTDGLKVSKDARQMLRAQGRDVESLTQHADALSNRTTFLLDAVLGLVGIEQNNVVKIFAVLSVVFMPPTLIGTIYGMNFKNLPELHWEYGYFMSLVAMVLSGVMPYLFFKRKGWL